MTEEQIKEYLEKYSLTTKEKLAEHIEQLKRNTNPNLGLISELVFVLADEENLFFNVFPREKEVKGWEYLNTIMTSEERVKNFVLLELENPKIVGDLEGINKPPHRAVSSHFLDEVLEDLSQKENKTEENKGHSTRLKANTPMEGKKESDGKLYYELSWEFIEEMAKRMANNKSDKYPLYNWKKNIDVEDLKQAINRHHIEVMKGNYKDGDEVLGHIISYACNSMMLWEQLNKC